MQFKWSPTFLLLEIQTCMMPRFYTNIFAFQVLATDNVQIMSFFICLYFSSFFFYTDFFLFHRMWFCITWKSCHIVRVSFPNINCLFVCLFMFMLIFSGNMCCDWCCHSSFDPTPSLSTLDKTRQINAVILSLRLDTLYRGFITQNRLLKLSQCPNK